MSCLVKCRQSSLASEAFHVFPSTILFLFSIQRDIPMLLDRPVVFSHSRLQTRVLQGWMSLVRNFSPLPCYLLVHALLCSALSIDLLATSAFPSKLLMFTSDVCIFPVVERLSSPSVYPVLSLFYGSHPTPSGAKPYRTRHKMTLLLLSVASCSTSAVFLPGHLHHHHFSCSTPRFTSVPPTKPTHYHCHGLSD